jgi:hypothetical protein
MSALTWPPDENTVDAIAFVLGRSASEQNKIELDALEEVVLDAFRRGVPVDQEMATRVRAFLNGVWDRLEELERDKGTA